jgi:hypothetical protein
MRSLTPRARWLAAGVAFIAAFGVAFVGVRGLDVDRSVPVTVGGYQHTGDPRQIVVNVMVGLSYDITEHSAQEDGTSVTVRIRAHAPGGAWPAIGIFIPVPITLRQDLGDRAVFDENGRQLNDLGQYRPPGAPSQ